MGGKSESPLDLGTKPSLDSSLQLNILGITAAIAARHFRSNFAPGQLPNLVQVRQHNVTKLSVYQVSDVRTMVSRCFDLCVHWLRAVPPVDLPRTS